MLKIHPLKLAASNCFLVQGEGNMLVDTGLPGEEGKIIRFLKQHKLEVKDLSLILHTHGHGDHCGSTVALLQKHTVSTAIHEKDRELVLLGNNGEVLATRFFARLIKPLVNRPFPGFQPEILIRNNEFNLQQFGIKANLLETPGHTPGSISLVFPSGEAIIGDLLMGGYFGGLLLPHLPDLPYFVTDLEKLKQSINLMLEQPADKFYVGHGGPLSREKIQQRFRYLLPNS